MRDEHDDEPTPLDPAYLPAISAIRELILAGEALRIEWAQARALGVRETTAISHLRDNPGMSQHELAQMLRLSPAAITALVDRLEARGLARRSMSPHDRRVTLLTITDVAREHLEFAFRALQVCVDGTPGIREPESLQMLMTLARRMREQSAPR